MHTTTTAGRIAAGTHLSTLVDAWTGHANYAVSQKKQETLNSCRNFPKCGEVMGKSLVSCVLLTHRVEHCGGYHERPQLRHATSIRPSVTRFVQNYIIK